MNDLLQQHVGSHSKLLIEVIKNSDVDSEGQVCEQTYAVIKGTPESLRFLGELLIRFASEDHGSTFFIHPSGPGSAHFDSASTCGIYLAKASASHIVPTSKP
jgi:hypothetical protein